MKSDYFLARLESLLNQQLPLPGAGNTPERFRRLMDIGIEDLSLARLAEAHFDAVAILAESGRTAEPGVKYGVWASEVPGHTLHRDPQSGAVSGAKMFCSGAGIVDRAIITIGSPHRNIVDIDLRRNAENITFDRSSWKAHAFNATQTATATFKDAATSGDEVVNDLDWYLDRPGFWHNAIGPAACWAGGAAGLVNFACQQRRNDAHTVAHLGAMHASVWALEALLQAAGREIDAQPEDAHRARIRALEVRHVMEQICTDILRRFARAYGPYPLAMNEAISRRYQELDLYLRQSHGERDLELIGRALLPGI